MTYLSEQQLIDNPKIKAILDKFKQEITQIYQDNLSQLILFGSQARGDAKADSDIDVLIVLKSSIKDQIKHEKVNRISSFFVHTNFVSKVVKMNNRPMRETTIKLK